MADLANVPGEQSSNMLRAGLGWDNFDEAIRRQVLLNQNRSQRDALTQARRFDGEMRVPQAWTLSGGSS